MDHVQAASEGRAVRLTVELGGDECEEQVRELLVEFLGLTCRESSVAQRALQRLGERMRVRGREGPREERHGPRVGEKDAARRVCEPIELAPPVVLRPWQLDLAVERVGDPIEQALLAANVPVKSHRRHTETLRHLAHAETVESALIRKRDRGTHDGIAVEP